MIQKNFYGKAFMVSKNPQKPRKFSTSDDLMYTVYVLERE